MREREREREREFEFTWEFVLIRLFSTIFRFIRVFYHFYSLSVNRKNADLGVEKIFIISIL